MSQFMQSIVKEIFNRNHAIVTSERKPSNPVPIQPSSLMQPSILEGIRRPNYQRQKQQERMKVEPAAPERIAESPIPPFPSLIMPENLTRIPRSKANNGGKGAQLIGITKSNQQVWYFSSPDHRLDALSKALAGLITGVIDHPGTVFIVEEWMGKRADITWKWFGERKSCGWSDAIELSCGDCQDLEPILKGLYNQLNRQAIRTIKSYYVENPTDYLRKSVPWAKGQSLSALAGISKISALALLDRYFHQHPEAIFQFEVRENMMLLSGDTPVVKEVIQQLEDDARQLFS